MTTSMSMSMHMPTLKNSSKHSFILFILSLSFFYLFYSLSLLHHSTIPPPPSPSRNAPSPTTLDHIVFGIASSSSLWPSRQHYINLWFRPPMRGFVWLDNPLTNSTTNTSSSSLILKLSTNTSSFPYTHKHGSRAALRLSRIVSETLHLNLPNVRWFVMCDDDTVFLPSNLLTLLNSFDHSQPYYIGSLSESHLQNIYFSYSMAYGGAGFAISYPLALSLSRFQDQCLHRYPSLYGSDDRIQACMAELGVPLTRHPGFHQYDVYGDLLGLLAAHPVAPLISLHHLDVVKPIFPSSPSRVAALQRLLAGPVSLDSAGTMQQSICYDKLNQWTVSVSWGFVIQIVRGVMSPREMEMPARTFLNWYPRADYTAYAFNTRPVARNPCQRPVFYYLLSASYDVRLRTTVTVYERHRDAQPTCRWKIEDPSQHINTVIVYKKPDPDLWNRAPRRNCCRVKPGGGERTMVVDVGVCRDGEISEI
ncbi:uncharacterized protein LOC120283320 [Dioscorea cayenensis subsp. rotundata]|uniref:Uncharacterized protein LOC120283320 n=1 Tax=Dioscorea cayennensis subsp. rotundata TaxID=55577 RepID=A0AB40D5D3_DIOCR|nr:uncharacterized protein LOC120283320 [Dioscorea cayenensis subsp. rotundata]